MRVAFFVLYILLVCMSCGGEKSNIYNLVKIDSLQIPTHEDLTVADYNSSNNKLLLYNRKSNSLYEYIIGANKLNKIVSENKKISDFNNVGYYNDSLIVVTALNGYYIIDVNTGVDKRFIKTDTTNTGGIWTRIRSYQNGKNRFLVSVYKNTMDKEINRGYRNKRSYYESYQPITIYNESNNIFRNGLGYEKSSIFRKFDYYYPNRNILFDINGKDSTFCIIHNPDHVLYTYKMSNLDTLYAAVDLKPNYFKILEKGIFDDYKKIDMDKNLMVNSNYRSLNINNNYILCTYDTGIPEDIYNSMISLTEYSRIQSTQNVIYAQFFYKRNKICDDVKLPDQCRKICGFKSLDYILLEDGLHSESKKNIFITRLIKHE